MLTQIDPLNLKLLLLWLGADQEDLALASDL